MKTTDSRDPLDRRIDTLLASQPAKAPEDFVARTLAAAEADKTTQREGPVRFAPLIRYALPIAAAITLALVIVSQLSQKTPDAPAELTGIAPLSSAFIGANSIELSSTEIDELLLLQEGLSGFADLETEVLSSDDLLHTLDTLYSI